MGCKLAVFSFTDKPDHPGAERLRRSAKYWGWDLKWLPPASDDWDPDFRIQQLTQLEALRKWEPDFFMYVDAWDVVFCGPPQELRLEPGVLNFCGDTLLGMWTNRVKMLFDADEYPMVPLNRFRFINDGVIWGDSSVMRELAGDYLQNYDGAINQDYFNQRYAFEQSLKRNRLRVDSEARTAINIMDMRRRFVDRRPNGRLTYIPTGTIPIVLHSPGTRTIAGLDRAPIPSWMEEEYCSDAS